MPPELSVPVPGAVVATDVKLRASGSREICSDVPVTPIVVLAVSMTGASPVTTTSSLTETESCSGTEATPPMLTFTVRRSAFVKPESAAVTV